MDERIRFEFDGIVYSIISDNSVEVSRMNGKTKADVVIPSIVPFQECFYHVRRIGEMAFYGNDVLVTIILPDGVEEIGEAAFSCCSALISVNIPEGVKTIAYETFFGCESLSSLFIPDSVICVEERALWYCRSLRTISIPKHLLGIEYPRIFPKRAMETGQCRSLDNLEHCFVRDVSGVVGEFDVD